MIKKVSKLAAKSLARSEFAFNALDACAGRAIDFLRLQRRMYLESFDTSDPLLDQLGLTVLNGPFRGMKYPDQLSMCSTFPPKIIGSYESELSSLVESFCAKSPALIIDIGCAEGYYAVGMALRCEKAEVWAFDSDPVAQRACSQMAELNGVSDRVHVNGFCSSIDVDRLCHGRHALIICDCEGYESTLFDPLNIRSFSRCELLVEVHDFIDPEISLNLIKAFSSTHSVSSIFSVDDIVKAQTYDYAALAGLSIVQRKRLLAEHRPCVMRWLNLAPL